MTLDDIKKSKVAHLNPHLPKVKKKSKYNNQNIKIDGYTFDSKKEATRYGELKILQIWGDITGLEVHKVFQLSVCKYEADFIYYRDGEMIVEDVKSKATRRLSTYRLKNKMMLNELGITIKEI